MVSDIKSPSAPATKKTYKFLSGDGEMARLISSYDWADTSLGPIDTWPQSLRTTVSLLLHSKFPMFLWWGDELVQFYNDAYRPILGNTGKHPTALGQKGEDCWREIWPFIKPLIDQVKTEGAATWHEDQGMTVLRNNKMEDIFGTFSYSPVYDEQEKIAGIFVTCIETTDKVLSVIKQKASDQRFQNLIREATIGIIVLTGEEMRVDIVNEAYTRLINLTPADLLGKPLFDIIPGAQRYFYPMLLDVLRSGNPVYLFDTPYHVTVRGEEISGYLNIVYQPYREHDKTITGVTALVQDVTESVIARKKIEESEKQLRFATDAAELGTWDYDPVTKQFKGNDRLKDWFGLSHDENINLAVAVNLMAEQDRLRVSEAIQYAIITGDLYDIEYTIIHSLTGQQRVVRALGRATFDDDNIACRFNGTMQDITEQVSAREKMKESELFASKVIHNSLTAQCIWVGYDMTFSMANEKMLEIFGRDASIIGQPYMDAIPELKETPLMDRLRHVLLTGETFRQPEEEFTLIRNGEPYTGHYSYAYQVLTNAAGQNYGVICTCSEVTDQVIARHKIQEAQLQVQSTAERLQLAIGAGELGSFELNIDSGVIECTEQCKLNCGFLSDDLFTYDKLVAAILPEDSAAMQEAVQKSLRDKSIFNAEYRVKWHDGPVRWVRAAGRPVYSADGKPLKMVGITINITEQKLFAEELGKQVKERTTELQRSNEDLLQFAHVTSHDLKEPIRKIKLFTNRIQTEYGGQLPEPGQQYLNRVQSATDRVITMIEGILSYSTLGASGQPVASINLNQILKDIETDLEVIIHQKSAVIKKDMLPDIEGTPILISQLFYNIINNSLKFSDPATPLIISITSGIVTAGGRPWVDITFSDNGIGFDQEYSEKIFNTFTRLNSKDKYEGTGLGLTLCKKIAERHGGTISASGAKGKGASFKVSLPVRQTEKII